MAVITNLLNYWSLDEASGDALPAHGSMTLTDTNTVGAASGKVSGARDFEADNVEYFSHTDHADLSAGDTDFTFQAWVNLESKSLGSNTRVIFRKWDGAGTEYILWYDAGTLATDRFSWVVRGSGTLSHVEANVLGSPSIATWYLIHAWHDSVNNEIGIAVNAGTADTTAHSAGVDDTAAVFYIGHEDGASDEWDGLLDECAMWRKVLTSAERTWLYNSGAGRSYADIVAESSGYTPAAGALVFTGPIAQLRYQINMPDEA